MCKQYNSLRKWPCKEEVIDLDDGDEEAGPSRSAKRKQSSHPLHAVRSETGCCQQGLALLHGYLPISLQA
eukprot:1136537-Pelagomonas_calceolata.AAC.2